MTSASLSCPICSRMRGDSGSASSPMTASGVGMAQTIKKMCQALKCSCPSSTTITPKNTHVDTNHEQRKEICWKRIDILPHANPKTVTQFSGGTSHQQSIPAVFRSIVFAWFSLLVAWPHKQHPPIAGFKYDFIFFFCFQISNGFTHPHHPGNVRFYNLQGLRPTQFLIKAWAYYR